MYKFYSHQSVRVLHFFSRVCLTDMTQITDRIELDLIVQMPISLTMVSRDLVMADHGMTIDDVVP